MLPPAAGQALGPAAPPSTAGGGGGGPAEHLALAFQCVASSAWVVGALLMGLSSSADVFHFVAAVAWTIGNVCAAHGMGWFDLCAGHGKGTGPAATPSPGSRSWRRLLSGQGFGGGGDAVAKSPAPSLELT